MPTYSDPSRLFTIALPEGFRRDERAKKSLVFRHDDLDGAVTISCLRHRLDNAEINLFDALPSRDNMQNVRRGVARGMNFVYGEYEGELMNAPEAWRWWTFQRGPVGVVVSFNGSPDADDDQRELVDSLVEGIEIVDRPPRGGEDFTALAADIYAETLKTARPQISKPFELTADGRSVLRLENAYLEYLRAWEADHGVDATATLRAWIERLWGESSRPLESFEHTRALLYPVVKPAGFGRETRVPILRRTLVARELELLVAVDTGRTLRFVSEEDLARWEGTTEDDVYFYARENLLALSEDLQLQAIADQSGKPRMVVFETRDSHDASRIILPNLYEKLSAVLGPELLVGIPNRDFMIVLDATDPELVENVRAQVKRDAETQAYAISPKLYRLTKDGLAGA